MNNNLLSIFFIIYFWQSHSAAPFYDTNGREDQTPVDLEDAIGMSMDRYKAQIVESFTRAVKGRNIEEMASRCEILIREEVFNVNLTLEQHQHIEPFFNQFLNRIKIMPDPLEIAEAFQICKYLRYPNANEGNGVSVSEFMETEAIKNSVPMTRRLCRLKNRHQGIIFPVPQESVTLTDQQLHEYVSFLSKGVDSKLLERALFPRNVCVYLNETIPTEDYVKMLDITMDQYKALTDDLLSVLAGDLNGLVKICDLFDPPPEGMFTVLKLFEFGIPAPQKRRGRMMSNSLKATISGIVLINIAITNTIISK